MEDLTKAILINCQCQAIFIKRIKINVNDNFKDKINKIAIIEIQSIQEQKIAKFMIIILLHQ
jgi:hypothetical protein